MEPAPRLLVVAALVWLDDETLLVQRRAPTASFGAGMLELPGGKVERGESPAGALARELVEEWGSDAARLHVGRVVEVLHHEYPAPGPEVVLVVYDVDGSAWGESWARRVRAEAGAQVVAFHATALPVDAFLPADREFVGRVRTAGRRSPA